MCYREEAIECVKDHVLLLKNAANIDEALALLKASDMNSDPGSAYHFSMADATGRSVAVEYVENQMVVTESPFVTNHYLCEEKFLVGLHEGTVDEVAHADGDAHKDFRCEATT